MENIVITWRELLIVVALILAVYIAEMLLLMRRGESVFRKPRLLRLLHERQTESALRAELDQLVARVAALEAQMDDMNAENQEAEGTPYQRAILMARQGRDAQRISENCGISHGEAELIVSMHRVRD